MAESYRVIVTGVADVRDREKSPISDPELLRKLDGIEYRGDEFTEYLGGPAQESLIEALAPGGDIALNFDEDLELLLYVTEYKSKRKLTDDELTRLFDYTTGQWSDGIGSGFNSYCWDNHDTWMDYPCYKHMDKSQITMLTADGTIVVPDAPPVVQAVLDGDIEVLKTAVADGNPLNDTFNGATALHIAIRQKTPAIALEVVAAGAQLDCRDRSEEDALSMAAAILADRDAAQVVQAIIEKDIADNEKVTLILRKPAIIALEQEKSDTLEVVLSYGGKQLRDDVMRFAK